MTARGESGDISLFDLITPLVRRWRLITGVTLAGAVVAAITLLLQRSVYTGTTTFTPESPTPSGLTGGLAGLAGLAGQLGISVLSPTTVSPDFFSGVLHSREILGATLESEFPDSSKSPPSAARKLIDILHIRGESPRERMEKGIRRLTDQTDVEIDRRTGIVSLGVEMPTRELAAQVANRMVDLLNRFNLERRQSQSREERRFSGERLATAERELRAAEQAHLSFLQRNRAYSDSPLLSFEANRLSRDVQLKQEVFLTLTKTYEQARISEVRDTPVLTVIDSAVPPVLRSRPRRVLGTVIAAFLAALVGVVAAYVLELRARARSQGRADYQSLREAWQGARREVATTLGERP
jgi:uncharacterized protein involved in exopolysaccharide biosynthesis